jgi:hypothetical protein
MRRDKTVAQILLIFSITSVVLAAPALVRQRRLVTYRADDEPTDELEQAPGSLAEPVHQNGVLPAAPPSVGSPARSDLSLSDSLLDWLDEVMYEHSPPISPLHPDYMLEPPLGLLHQDFVPVSGAPESHGDVPLESGGRGSHDYPFPWWLHTTERPPSQFEVGESSSHIESGAPGGLPPASGTQPLHDLNPLTDVEQAATRLESWGSHGTAWSADDMHLPFRPV